MPRLSATVRVIDDLNRLNGDRLVRQYFRSIDEHSIAEEDGRTVAAVCDVALESALEYRHDGDTFSEHQDTGLTEM